MSAPARSRDPNDADLADAFRNLESAIGGLRDMTALMEIAAEATIFQVEGEMARRIREKSGIKGYRLYVLTQDQSYGLDYAVRHTRNLIHALYDTYYADLTGGEA